MQRDPQLKQVFWREVLQSSFLFQRLIYSWEIDRSGALLSLSKTGYGLTMNRLGSSLLKGESHGSSLLLNETC